MMSHGNGCGCMMSKNWMTRLLNRGPVVKLTNERVRTWALKLTVGVVVLDVINSVAAYCTFKSMYGLFTDTPEYQIRLKFLDVLNFIEGPTRTVAMLSLCVFLVCMHRSVKRLTHPTACRSCGYDRRGKSDGPCPECGAGGEIDE